MLVKNPWKSMIKRNILNLVYEIHTKSVFQECAGPLL